ncbi:cytochrome P450 [Streptosporangium becharense]|uniref:Cytochrome P450 n=1 Tax=Streptosporangium becharense TaxID=1816182 RepID=A0A7W9IIH6_9ACTN|nr:cytochrome P450 [Streptosporangium becharense]MBB2914703.1 cytochrome P450 [Streptosporangium becharense]MBB5820896.1 cytochrome P450 [Streptosporangium becharense]
MTSGTLLQQILDHANRPDPYPLYAALRETPVSRQDGVYVVSTYWEILGLLHDPRLSSDTRNRTPGAGGPLTADEEEDPNLPVSFLRLDPPEHDRLRRLTTRAFGPPVCPRRVHDMRGELSRMVAGLIDGFEGRDEVDIVEDLAYPFPVMVICKLLGVPHQDEPRFHAWSEAIVSGLDPSGGPGTSEDSGRPAGPATSDGPATSRGPVTVDGPAASDGPAERRRGAQQARRELGMYLAELIEEHRRTPGDDVLSALVTDRGPEGRLSPVDLVVTAVLLLIAGHETTVNLIANGTLTLLRNPGTLRRLRDDPRLAIPLVEELLRFEPPVQLLPQRTALADLDVAGTTIPKGAPVWLMLASGNRDPRRFTDPDRFDPDRRDNRHLGFGSGVHYCFGAPLARLEAQLALAGIARRLTGPRLVTDPPPYRRNPVLRGPRHLRVAFDGLAP